MRITVYAMYDKATKQYTTPYFADRDEVAKRILLNSLSAQSQLVLYPSDYSLYMVGVFCDETGSLHPVSEPQLVCEMRNLIPVGLRKYAIDGTYERSDYHGQTPQDTPAQGSETV